MVGAVSLLMIVSPLTGRADATTRASQDASTGGSTMSISTSQFVNQFDTEPYVGNGYFSQRIPAAGMGLLTGLGTIGWPLGTPRFTEALAAGLYAQTNASLIYPDESKQVIALIPTWSTLNFSTPSGDVYSPATVTSSQISNYRPDRRPADWHGYDIRYLDLTSRREGQLQVPSIHRSGPQACRRRLAVADPGMERLHDGHGPARWPRREPSAGGGLGCRPEHAHQLCEVKGDRNRLPGR